MTASANLNPAFDLSNVRDLHARLANETVDHSRKISFVHIVCPVQKPAEHELMRAQSVTYSSMRTAAEFAIAQDENLDVRLVAAALPEDEPAHPNGFVKLPNLERTSEDIGEFETPRRLPLMYDIIRSGEVYCEGADLAGEVYLIFTNADIGVSAQFYSYCAWLARHKFDTVVINRRSIEEIYSNVQHDWPAMLCDFGEVHPGFDCFVMRTSVVKQLVPFKSVVGMAFVMRSLLYGLIAHSERSVIITDAHATFHIGNDRYWMSAKYDDYKAFNKSECYKTIGELIGNTPSLEPKLAAAAFRLNDALRMPAGTFAPASYARHTSKNSLLKKLVGKFRQLVRPSANN